MPHGDDDGAAPTPAGGRGGAVVHQHAGDVPADGPGPTVRAGAPATAGRTSPRAWRAPAAVGLAVVTATAVLAVRSPYGSGSYGVCPLLAVTGLWCPFCGGLRAVHELTQADLAGAWAMNPLVVLGVPVLVLAWGAWLLAALGRQVPRSTAASWPAWALLGVAVVFGVARNVPALAPWLAPV